MIEHHKDVIEQQTGIRPRFILDIGAGDIPGYSEPSITNEPKAASRPARRKRR